MLVCSLLICSRLHSRLITPHSTCINSPKAPRPNALPTSRTASSSNSSLSSCCNSPYALSRNSSMEWIPVLDSSTARTATILQLPQSHAGVEAVQPSTTTHTESYCIRAWLDTAASQQHASKGTAPVNSLGYSHLHATTPSRATDIIDNDHNEWESLPRSSSGSSNSDTWFINAAFNPQKLCPVPVVIAPLAQPSPAASCPPASNANSEQLVSCNPATTPTHGNVQLSQANSKVSRSSSSSDAVHVGATAGKAENHSLQDMQQDDADIWSNNSSNMSVRSSLSSAGNVNYNASVGDEIHSLHSEMRMGQAASEPASSVHSMDGGTTASDEVVQLPPGVDATTEQAEPASAAASVVFTQLEVQLPPSIVQDGSGASTDAAEDAVDGAADEDGGSISRSVSTASDWSMISR